MPDLTGKKRRRVVFASLSLLTLFVAGGIVLAFVEKMRDVSDRAT